MFRVVAALDNGGELLDVTTRQAVDVVVLDYELARSDGLALCQRLKLRRQPPRVLIYSAYAGPALMVPAAIAQADAVVSKAEPVAILLDAIRRIARGERLIPPPPADLLKAASARMDPIDVPVIPMLVHGATMRDIADALSVDEREVVRRAQRIIGRLHAGRTGLRRADRG